MSLQAIEQAIEKVALVMPGFMARAGKVLTSKPHLKDIGIKAGIGAGVGGLYNAATGNSDEGVGTRFLKGAVGGGLAGGAFGAGKHLVNANKGLQRLASRPGAASSLATKKPVV